MPKWRNKIEIKSYFTDDESNESVLKVVNALISQLKMVLRRERNRKNKKLEDYYLEEFENLIEEFIWIKNMIERNCSPEEYDYTSWCEAFNEYLEQLYDMGDMVTDNHDDFWNREKFLWVG
jgi:hypothetical protein